MLLYLPVILQLLPVSAIFQSQCAPRLTEQQIADYFRVESSESSEYSEDSEYSEESSYFQVEAQSPAPTIQKSPKLSDLEGSCNNNLEGNCGAGWRSWSRPSGEWCMKIFYENSINQSTSESRCQEHGAKLSGFQNQLELLWVTYTVSTKIAPATGGVWIGYKRRPACFHTRVNANCTAFNTFEWTDGVTTGTDGILWLCGQPDNAKGVKRNQDCARLVVGSTAYVTGYQTGTVDDVECNYDFIRTKREAHDIKAYVCGKKP